MNLLIDAAGEVGAFMTRRQWPYCVVGGLAVQQWGEPRTTLDADFTLLAGWGEETMYADALLGAFEGRIPDARTFAVARRVALLRTASGVDVDVIFGALPFEEAMIARAVVVDFGPGARLPCCTAEDLVVMKVFAGRPRDLSDAEGVVARQGRLDDAYILEHIAELAGLKEDPDMTVRARRILGRRP